MFKCFNIFEFFKADIAPFAAFVDFLTWRLHSRAPFHISPKPPSSPSPPFPTLLLTCPTHPPPFLLYILCSPSPLPLPSGYSLNLPSLLPPPSPLPAPSPLVPSPLPFSLNHSNDLGRK